jgi:DNA-binding HxlR family transcriptional regulator
MEVVNSISQSATVHPVGERRTYNQICSLAAALDVIGERWTLLIVRDLGFGPRRYGELLDGLPGIGEGLLAQRLRHLEANGIVRRNFSPAAGAVVYELDERGLSLFEALVPLARWGIDLVRDLEDGRADHVLLTLRSRLDASQSVGVHESYELRIDDEPYTIVADDGTLRIERGAAPDATVHVTLDLATAMLLGTRQMTLAEARRRGLSKVEGDKAAIARYGRLLRGFVLK